MILKPTSIDQEYAPPGESASETQILTTPHALAMVYQGEIVYFNGVDRRQTLTEDPMNSCFASRMLSGK